MSPAVSSVATLLTDTMSSIPVTTDMLPNNIPKLNVKETNWKIFSFHFQVAVKAKALLDHFDSMITTPSVSNPATNEETEALNTWHKIEGMVEYLLTQHIPDSTVLHVRVLLMFTKCGQRSSRSTPKRGHTSANLLATVQSCIVLHSLHSSHNSHS